MFDIQDIKNLLKPLLKGSPFILLFTVVCVFMARRSVVYITPQFESTGKVKLDDSQVGIGNNVMYKDFDFYSTKNKIATELEVIKSKEFLKKVLAKMDWSVDYFRKGEIKKTELFGQSPFKIDFEITDESHYNRPFEIQLISQNEGRLIYSAKGENHQHDFLFCNKIKGDGFNFTINQNNENFDKIFSAAEKDQFSFVVSSEEDLLTKISSQMHIKSADKDIPVLRISYKDPIPEKTSTFVNNVIKTYIEDYIENKSETAGKTVDFIDQSLNNVARKLKASEIALENFKLENNLINLKQETEVSLKKIAELEVQLANLQMNENALTELKEYIQSTDGDLGKNPPHVGFGDLLFTEVFKNLRALESEKNRLDLLYESSHPEVVKVTREIDETQDYLRLSILNASRDISTKKSSIENILIDEEKGISNMPTKEKQLVILERAFLQNQKTFNFLTEKRTEASIASVANMSFHRVLQWAKTPNGPVSPQKTLIYIVAGFLGLLISSMIVYLFSFLRMKINNISEIEKKSDVPILGTLTSFGKHSTHFQDRLNALITKLFRKNGLSPHQLIVISSAIRKEGKSFVAFNLAKNFAELGYKTLLIDFDLRNPQIHNLANVENNFGLVDYIRDDVDKDKCIVNSTHSNLSVMCSGSYVENPGALSNHRDLTEKMEEMKSEFDFVILDTPAVSNVSDGINLMALANQNIYLIRANFTPPSILVNADYIKENYNPNNFSILLNGVGKSTSYEGILSGRRYKNAYGKWKDLFKSGSRKLKENNENKKLEKSIS